jgi:hypothetical protein
MPDAPLRSVVVGSGPAGFYATGSLLAARFPVEVDLVDRLPTPWGLVRTGVAPDHPHTVKCSYLIYTKPQHCETLESSSPSKNRISYLHGNRDLVPKYSHPKEFQPFVDFFDVHH